MKKPILFAALFVMVMASVAAILQSGWTSTTNPGVARTALGVPGLTNNNAFTGSNFISGYIASQNGSGTNTALTGSTNWGSVGRSNWTRMYEGGWDNTNNSAANQGVRISRGQVVIDGGGTNVTQLSVGGTSFVVGTNNTVGIGLSNPAAKLHLTNSGGLSILLSDGTETWQVDNGQAAAGMFSITEMGAGRRLVIENNTGNVGIGTTTPSAKLTVTGNANISTVLDINTSSGAENQFHFLNDGRFQVGNYDTNDENQVHIQHTQTTNRFATNRYTTRTTTTIDETGLSDSHGYGSVLGKIIVKNNSTYNLIQGVYGFAQAQGAATVTNLTAGRFIADHNGTGIVRFNTGIDIETRTSGAGNIETNYGLRIHDFDIDSSGTVTGANFGIMIEDQAKGSGLMYGLYQAGAASNLFGGDIWASKRLIFPATANDNSIGISFNGESSISRFGANGIAIIAGGGMYVDNNVLPKTTASHDLGSGSLSWRNSTYSGTVTTAMLKSTGSATIGSSAAANATLDVAGNIRATTITLTNAPTFGITSAPPAGFLIGTTVPVTWFAITNAGVRYLVPGYTP